MSDLGVGLWTITGSDIYRNSNVLIGATAFTPPTTRLEVIHSTDNYDNGITITNSRSWGFGSAITFKAQLTSGAVSFLPAAKIQQDYESSNNYNLKFYTVGSGTLAERARINANGTFQLFNINNLGSSTTEVLVPSGTGVVSKRTLTEFKSDLGVAVIESSSLTVKFDNAGGYIHGNSGALTGNISYDFANEILGTTAFMLHNSGTVPTFPSETRIIRGNYVLSANNYIWFCLTKTTTGRIVQVTIGQV